MELAIQRDAPLPTTSLSRNAVVFGVLVVFHVVVIWALAVSLKKAEGSRQPTIIKAEIIEEITSEEEAPPPPPTIEAPPPYVPPPDINVAAPVQQTQSTALTQVTTERAPPPPPVQKAAVKKAPEISANARRRFQPEYPPTSRRLGEEGSVTLRVLVGTDGRVMDGQVQASSGFPRLDEAALKHALRAWRFNPGTEDGAAVQMWHQVKVTFKIEG